MRRRPRRRLLRARRRTRQVRRRRARALGGSVRRRRREHSALRTTRSGRETRRKTPMNPVRDDELDPPRILGRLLAQETTDEELDEAHGGKKGLPKWTLTFPPDKG